MTRRDASPPSSTRRNESTIAAQNASAISIRGAFVFLLVGLVCCGANIASSIADESTEVRSQTEATQLATRYVQAATARVRLNAEKAWYDRMAGQLESRASVEELTSDLKTVLSNDPPIGRKLTSIMESANQGFLNELEERLRASQAEETRQIAEWSTTRSSLNQQRSVVEEAANSRRVVTQIAFLLSVDNRWFWLFGLIGAIALAAACIHARRQGFRRFLNGGKAKALRASQFLLVIIAILGVGTLATFLLGDQIYETLVFASAPGGESVREQMKRDVEAVEREVEQAKPLQAQSRTHFAAAVDKSLRQLQSSAAPAAQLPQQWQKHLDTMAAVHAGLAVRTDAATRHQADAIQLEEEARRVAEREDELASYHRMRGYLRMGMGGFLASIPLIGGLVLTRSLRRRQRSIRNTCPQCLGVGTFETVSNGGLSGRAGLEMVRCKNVVSQHPFTECDFTFAANYREMEKLCFPTLGIPQSGKTHWLLMVYRELNRGNFPKAVQFSRIKSPAAEELDEKVDALLNSRVAPYATQSDTIPHPLLFNFRDSDPVGKSNLLVNIFDYSGEVIQRMTLEDHQRHRALEGDGFLFFLDPTFPSEPQAEALARFREDLYQVKGIKVGTQLRIPVALCITKIDLLVNQPFASPDGGGVVGEFYQRLGGIGWEMDLASIALRSRIIHELRETIWPGWQIERQIHDLFGGRFMYFPLSPVGLDNVGETDLSRRVLAPVGILHPMMWLLHMNGYPVLK